MPKSWEEINSFDEIIKPDEKEIILKLERKSRQNCPFLKKDGEFFYYCGKDMTEMASDKLSPFNPVYWRHVHVGEMSMNCMSDFEVCCIYKRIIKRIDF